MKNGTIKRIIATIGVIASSLCIIAAPVTTLPVEASSSAEESIDPRADILEWVYRETDGKIYKRLMNCETGEWVGDWIYVGEA